VEGGWFLCCENEMVVENKNRYRANTRRLMK
jgi:hypothetical protein